LRYYNIVYGVSPEIDIVLDLRLGKEDEVSAFVPESPGSSISDPVVVNQRVALAKLDVEAEGVGRPSAGGIVSVFSHEEIPLSECYEEGRLQEQRNRLNVAMYPEALPQDVEAAKAAVQLRQRLVLDSPNLKVRTRYYSAGSFASFDSAVVEMVAAERRAIGHEYLRVKALPTVVFNKDESKFRLQELIDRYSERKTDVVGEEEKKADG